MNTATHLAPASCLKANIRTTALLALGVLASAAVAGPQTDIAPVSRSAKVSLAGLDLSTPEGARAARERLRETARRLCSQVADELDLSHQPNFVACVDDTLTAALRKVTEAGASTASAKGAQTGTVATKSDQSTPVAPGSRSAKVSLADLDLTTPEGARAARERLHQAARRLCTQVADSLDLSRHTNYVACVDESLTRALRQTAIPALVAGAPAARASMEGH